MLLAFSQEKILPKADGLRRAKQRLFTHGRRPRPAHAPLAHGGIGFKQIAARAKLEHSVAEELQPLVVLSAVRGVGERLPQQRFIPETVSDPLL